jgi:hypothetical protein
VLEVGPCTTLSRLWNRLHPDVPARSLEDFQGPEGVWRWVERCLGGEGGCSAALPVSRGKAAPAQSGILHRALVPVAVTSCGLIETP